MNTDMNQYWIFQYALTVVKRNDDKQVAVVLG